MEIWWIFVIPNSFQKDKILADKGGHTFELFHKNKKILEIISPHCDIFGVQYCSTWFEVMAEIKWKSPL